MRLDTLGVILPLLLLLIEGIDASQIYSSRKRYVPQSGKSRFRLTSRPKAHSQLRYGGKYTSSRRSRLGQTSALKSGREGSYDFSGQSNAIIPNKAVLAKPTKAPKVTTPNPNKINIESRIPAVTETRTIKEKANVGGTAILHCYFDDEQTGQVKHSQIWWTKQPQRATDRPMILGAGTQVRLPDDRLKLVTFPEESYSILVIRDVLMSDAGDYKCSLPTVSGTQTEFVSLTVYDSGAEDIDVSPAESIAEVGSDFELFCKPQNPSLSVWWTAKRLTGETMEIVKGKRKVSTRELNLKNVRQSDAGVYTCHIQLLAGAPIQKEFTLKVKEKPWPITAFNGGFNIDTFLSKFSKDPEYGDEVNLRCDSGGIPTPTITWTFDNIELANGDKYKIKSYEPTYTDNAIIGSLTITNFSPEDEGRYHCIATNEIGARSREFTIKGYYNKSLQSAKVVSLDDEDVPALISSAKLAFGHKEEQVEGSGEEEAKFL